MEINELLLFEIKKFYTSLLLIVQASLFCLSGIKKQHFLFCWAFHVAVSRGKGLVSPSHVCVCVCVCVCECEKNVDGDDKTVESLEHYAGGPLHV